MNHRLTYVIAFVLAAHGLVHFLGPVAYFELAPIPELPYKTTLFGGAVDVGDLGIRLFGLAWAVAGVGFLAVAVGMAVGWASWDRALGAVAVVSLVLTVADWTVAFAGVAVNLVILAGLVVYWRR